MKNLFEPARAAELKERLLRLRPDSERQWGKMSPAQAVAHCSIAMEMALGDTRAPRMLAGRIFGRIVKALALRNDAPIRRNTPTVPELVVADERSLDTERQRLSVLIDRFTAAGPAGCTTHPHAFFGRLTPQEWSVLMYKHVDHHLRQFEA
ncbi:MAG TPA: DUF1569 domain-containing protein [Longimicrobium sp.]|jgi:hypothetical protein